MRGSLRIATIAGIGIFVHWTFALLIGWVVFAQVRAGADARGAGIAVAFVLLLFGCIVLHELGHALTARRFGITTRDITLLPIGGLARLERMPDKPWQEFLVAIAGPAVNVVIFLVLLAAIIATNSWPDFEAIKDSGEKQVTLGDASLLFWLLTANFLLVAFNMLPAFPMDGGRMLRALLATRLDYATATRIAAGVGQVMAVLFAIAGFLTWNLVLLFIALFVFLGAQAEAQAAVAKAAFEGVRALDAMITRFKALSPHETLAEASEELLAGTQQDFPVVEDGRVVGVLARGDLVRALAEHGLEAEVGPFVRTDCAVVEAGERLAEALQRMRESGCPIAPVVQEGRLVGLITPDNVTEIMMLRSAMRSRGRTDLGPIERGA
jgi:Zn-dependent protease/CBS domain-containing protein